VQQIKIDEKWPKILIFAEVGENPLNLPDLQRKQITLTVLHFV
jgi:hypothetical protein